MISAGSISGGPEQDRLLRVVKVGGSLLDWPLLATKLVGWLECQPDANNILVAGGGALADVIRRADAAHGLGEEASHALCVEVLGITARLLAAVLPGQTKLATWAELQALQSANRLPACQVLDVKDFIHAAEATAPLTKLPHTWEVTSDSIAAWVACALAADELVLLKSCNPPDDVPNEAPYQALAAAGYVDRYFPTAVATYGGRVRLDNLRGFAAD
jgi:aspartokinase-like uncharacterized kinase